MTRLLIWDAPNMDMSLGEIYGRMPFATERPDMKAIMRWYKNTNSIEQSLACIFVNYENRGGSNPKFHGWLRMLSGSGYTIFVKPKINSESDVDDDMIAHIKDHLDGLTEIVIASHDANCFKELTVSLAALGVKIVVTGYSELANGWDMGNITFHDLESIEGVFKNPLPRHVNVFNLPSEGMFFEPTGHNATRQNRRIPAKRVNPIASRISSARALQNAQDAQSSEHSDAQIPSEPSGEPSPSAK